MNGIDYLADTNILVYILEGNQSVKSFLSNKLAVSVISEIELLGWYKINKNEVSVIKNLLGDCFVMELLPSIKEIAIELKQKNKIKLPDAIISATAIHLNVPLLTADKQLKNIRNLDSIVISV